MAVASKSLWLNSWRSIACRTPKRDEKKTSMMAYSTIVYLKTDKKKRICKLLSGTFFNVIAIHYSPLQSSLLQWTLITVCSQGWRGDPNIKLLCNRKLIFRHAAKRECLQGELHKQQLSSSLFPYAEITRREEERDKWKASSSVKFSSTFMGQHHCAHRNSRLQ